MVKTFPYLEVSGSYSDVGRAIGKKFKQEIQYRIDFCRKTFPDYKKLLKKIAPSMEVSFTAFPNIAEEMKGLVESAMVRMEDYFLVNTYEVDEFEFAEIERGRCTIAVSFNQGGSVIGHNEDWPSGDVDADGDLYILKATINGTAFLGLNYAAELPGTGATLNSWGLVQCINTLFSQQTKIGVPKAFLSRAVLECKTLDEAENIIRKANPAWGFNHVLVQGHELRNIEVASREVSVVRLKDMPYVHTNHFLNQEMKKYQSTKNISKSSIPRYERATEIIKNEMSKDDMVALISDKKNEQFPICQGLATLGSAVIIPEKKEVWICYGHPCEGEFVKYTL